MLLTPVPPFRLDLTVWGLRRRANNAVDLWAHGTYRRVLLLDGRPVVVAVRQVGPVDAPLLEVQADGDLRPGDEAKVAARLTHMLDIHRNLDGFYALAAQDPKLDPLAQRFRGLRPPRFASLYECLVNTIACQQVTVVFGLAMLNRLAATYGPAAPGPDGLLHALPPPEILAGIDPDELRALQFSGMKARALVLLARAVLAGEVDEAALSAMDDAAVVARLTRLWGVGRWTAEVALLRGLGRVSCFPGDDVGARGRLRHWLGLPVPLDYTSVQAVLAPWQPYAGMLYFLMLMDRMAAEGHIA